MKLEKPLVLGALLAATAVIAGAGALAQAPNRVSIAVSSPSTAGPGEALVPVVLPAPTPRAGEVAEPAFGPTLTRESLLSEVLARNPELAAAESSWRAALARAPQAAGLEDPMASYSLAPLSVAWSDAPFGHELRLSQRLPFPGTRRVRQEVAIAEAAASEQRIAEVRLRLATLAVLLYDQLWLVDRNREIAEEHLRLLAALKRVATARYTTGLAPQQAPLQAELEAARVEQELVVIEAERLRASAQINALLHRDPYAPLPPSPPLLESYDDEDATDESATPDHPHLRAHEAELEARRAGLELARRAILPDLELMTSYSTMWDVGDHRWMVGLGVNVPLWRKRRQAAVAEAEAELAAGEAELASRQDHLREEIARAQVSVDEGVKLLRLYRDRVLPAARDQLSAARASFESGATDMLGVIAAERGLRSAQMDYYATIAAHASRRSELESALGLLAGPLPHRSAHSSSAAFFPAEVTP